MTKRCVKDSTEIEEWAFQLAFEHWGTTEFTWPKYNPVTKISYFGSDNYPKYKEFRKILREFTVEKLRDGWRRKVYRIFHQMKFHTVRRI